MPARRERRSDPRAAIGARIRALRRAAGLSLEQLAERCGDLHPNYLGLVERAAKNPSIEVLARIADGLGVELSSLVDLRETATVSELRRALRDRIATMDAAALQRALRILDALR